MGQSMEDTRALLPVHGGQRKRPVAHQFELFETLAGVTQEELWDKGQ